MKVLKVKNRIITALTPDGLCRHPLYETFRAMLDRCYRKKSPDYRYYGGRNIKVSKRWRYKKLGRGFLNFLLDLGARPPGYTLERVDNNLGYTPQNCRWASWTEQNRNRRPYRVKIKDLKSMGS
jgi:hypothetical protein